MSFMQSLGNGWDIVKSANRVFIAHPKLIVPIIVTWAIEAPAFLYLKFFFHPQSGGESFLAVVLYIVTISILITLSCSIVLELIEQHESGQDMSLIRAGFDSWVLNFVKILPITLTYAAIWLIVTIISALLRSKKDDDEHDTGFSAENAARSLSGDDSFSLGNLLSGYFMKAVRMLVFLILPAICWEKKGPLAATKRGWKILKDHKGEFMSGFFMTELAAMVVFLPVAILLELTRGKHGLKLSDEVWYGVILYIGMAWSYCMYLEQMFSAELFLWYRKWETQNQNRAPGTPPLTLAQVEKPNLLDETFEFIPEDIQKKINQSTVLAEF